MSISTNNTSFQEDGDENMLFDDGFSIVDDLNIATGAAEMVEDSKERQKKKSNGKVCNSNISTEESNSKEVVSDKGVQDAVKVVIDEKRGKCDSLPKDYASAEKKACDLSNTSGKEVMNQETILDDQKSTKKNLSTNETLIISNDEELTFDESLIKTDKVISIPASVKNSSESETRSSTSGDISIKMKPKKNTETCFVWVSNITKLVKASSLKKHFSECGRVSTAKVVTNGKVFFGYVEFENSECVDNCVKKMNNSILGGRKILVSHNRPDVTKKTIVSSSKKPVNGSIKIGRTPKKSETSKKLVGEKDNSKVEDSKKKLGEKYKVEDKQRCLDEKETIDDKKKKISMEVQPQKLENDDLRFKLTDSKKRMESLKSDLDRSQIEISNLRRRLGNEQKKTRAEEMRCEKYRSEARSLADQLKKMRNDFEKEIHNLTKKHKLELEKTEYNRESLLKQKEHLKRREEDLDRENKKLDDAKKVFEHMKRSAKSRSTSPPAKRFRHRDSMFSDRHSPPPPPKLSSQARSKTLQERPTPFYEEKKSRVPYCHLVDYGDKSSQKEVNGRHRSSYPGDVISIPKSPWGHPQGESWKKPNTTSTFLKPYMERFGSSHSTYLPPSTSYHSSGASDYGHGHYDGSRKY